MIKIVCFDLDGTLLTDDKKILKENLEAIKKAKESGIEIVICTGRQNIAAKKFNELIGNNKYIICNNGAEILDTESGEELFACHIDREIAKILYSWIINDEGIVNFKFDTKYARYIDKRDSMLDYKVEFDKADDKFFDKNDILQMSVVFNSKINREKFIEKTKTLYGIKIENVFSLINPKTGEEQFYLNVINSSVSKGNGINGLAKYLKVNMDNVACFGDDINDLSMVKMVGHGIAMGNAIDILKENAKEVIENNNEPGIARVLERFMKENELEKNNN